jgi:hypothetical protein
MVPGTALEACRRHEGEAADVIGRLEAVAPA